MVDEGHEWTRKQSHTRNRGWGFDGVPRFPLVWMLVGTAGVGGVSALTAGGPPVLAVVGAVAAVGHALISIVAG